MLRFAEEEKTGTVSNKACKKRGPVEEGDWPWFACGGGVCYTMEHG
jgi:hypothetical protein